MTWAQQPERVSAYGECQTDLESTQLWDHQRNSMWQQGVQELHSQCPFNTWVLQQTAHRWKLHCAGCSTTAASSTSADMGPHMRGFRAFKRQGGMQDKGTTCRRYRASKLQKKKKKKKTYTSITNNRASAAREPWASTSPSVLLSQTKARKANTGKWALARKGLFEGYILPGEFTPHLASRRGEKQENILSYP